MYKNKKKNNYQGKVPSSPYCFFLNSINITEDINERVKMSFKNWWEETVVQWPWATAIFILSMIIFNYLLLLFGKYKKKFSGKGKSTWKKLRHNISRDSLLVVHCYFFFFHLFVSGTQFIAWMIMRFRHIATMTTRVVFITGSRK